MREYTSKPCPECGRKISKRARNAAQDGCVFCSEPEEEGTADD